MIEKYFKSLYQRTMYEAYSLADAEIVRTLNNGGKCLDCGANNGTKYTALNKMMHLEKDRYYGVEWNSNLAEEARSNDLNVVQGDLNKAMGFPNENFKCIFGL